MVHAEVRLDARAAGVTHTANAAASPSAAGRSPLRGVRARRAAPAGRCSPWTTASGMPPARVADHGQAHGHRVEHGGAKAFGDGAHHEQVRGLHQRQHVLAEARQAHCLLEVQILRPASRVPDAARLRRGSRGATSGTSASPAEWRRAGASAPCARRVPPRSRSPARRAAARTRRGCRAAAAAAPWPTSMPSCTTSTWRGGNAVVDQDVANGAGRGDEPRHLAVLPARERVVAAGGNPRGARRPAAAPATARRTTAPSPPSPPRADRARARFAAGTARMTRDSFHAADRSISLRGASPTRSGPSAARRYSSPSGCATSTARCPRSRSPRTVRSACCCPPRQVRAVSMWRLNTVPRVSRTSGRRSGRSSPRRSGRARRRESRRAGRSCGRNAAGG